MYASRTGSVTPEFHRKLETQEMFFFCFFFWEKKILYFFSPYRDRVTNESVHKRRPRNEIINEDIKIWEKLNSFAMSSEWNKIQCLKLRNRLGNVEEEDKEEKYIQKCIQNIQVAVDTARDCSMRWDMVAQACSAQSA